MGDCALTEVKSASEMDIKLDVNEGIVNGRFESRDTLLFRILLYTLEKVVG